jgi:hypothetical protein
MKTGVGPVKSLAAQSATTATPVILDAGTVRPNATLVVTTSAGTSAGVVALTAAFESRSTDTAKVCRTQDRLVRASAVPADFGTRHRA